MKKNSFHKYAIITIIFWALAYVFTKLALQYFSTTALGCLRYIVASALLIFIIVLKKIELPEKRDIPWFILAGGTGFFLYMIAYNRGQQMVTVSTSSVVLATGPVLTALLASMVYREKLKPYKWIAILISFLGVVILTLLNGELSTNSGVIWLLASAITLSIYNLLQRKLTKKYTGLQTSAYSIICGSIMLCIFLPNSIEEFINAPLIQIFYLLMLGIFSSVVAYVCWAKAFERAEKTSDVSNYMFVTPFLTSLLGFIMIGEVPDKSTIIGGIVILVGVFIFNFGEKLILKLDKNI